jgi:hypothetical protein
MNVRNRGKITKYSKLETDQHVVLISLDNSVEKCILSIR